MDGKSGFNCDEKWKKNKKKCNEFNAMRESESQPEQWWWNSLHEKRTWNKFYNYILQLATVNCKIATASSSSNGDDRRQWWTKIKVAKPISGRKREHRHARDRERERKRNTLTTNYFNIRAKCCAASFFNWCKEAVQHTGNSTCVNEHSY